MMKMGLVDKDGRKINVYIAAARDEVDPAALEYYGTGITAPLRYMMCEGCDKPVVIHGDFFDKAVNDSAKETRRLVVWCIECLNVLAFEARFEGGKSPKDIGSA